jgi:tripartite-type tricarboxylate transporter receptor subunit TctC
MRRTFLQAGVAAFASVWLGKAARVWAAEPYPSRPVKITVGYAPGGGTDIMARLIGQRLQADLGQPTIIDNRPGAGQNIASSYVAKSPPDGHTLLLGSAALGINISLYPNLDYDPEKSFVPVALFGRSPNLLVVPRALGVESVAQFIDYAKKHPASTNFSSSGAGSSQHLACELFKQETRIEARHVPYRGSSPSITAVMSGDVEFTFVNVAAMMPLMQSDKLRVLAVSSAKRLAQLPNIPTLEESGVKNMDVAAWYGLLAPAGTPRAIVDKLNAAVNAAVADAAFAAQLQKAGADPIQATPAEFGRFLAEEIARWRKVVRAGNLKPD